MSDDTRFTYGDMRELRRIHGIALVMVDDDGNVFSADPGDYWSAADSDTLPDGLTLALHVPEHYVVIQ